jgi:hypothetical protein
VIVEPTGHQGWEKEDSYRPSPMTNKELIQSWPEHCEQGLGRNDCFRDLAALSCKLLRELVNGCVPMMEGGSNGFSFRNHILE